MIAALLFTLLFAASGVCISEVVFHKKCFADRLWLGLTLGLLLLTWLPSLFAFAIGFTLTAQMLSVIVAILGDVVCAILLIRRKRRICVDYSLRREWKMPLVVIPIVALGCVLLNTHILYPHEDGSLWVGQVTYGDLAMHLGFITSIAEQTVFPPQYSIFPGHALNYPFLCETSGASLYQLGASIRQAYLISAVYAFVLVVTGVYRFMKQWLKRDNRAILATILFFFGSGFGFFYFFDLAKSGGILQYLVSETSNQTVSQALLDGFYHTPTNIPAIGLRWVNVIVDMFIPQRATLFGWAFLFPCLYLLHGFAFERKTENMIMLGIFAGALPLIHTHSFLALGVISAVYCIGDLIRVRFEKRRLLDWLTYGVIACVLAAPQLFFFSFRQAAESSLVRFHLNWGNTTDSYLWFYIKNMGLIFLLMPFAVLILPKRDRQIYTGVFVLWMISEFLEFQPNDYDNNKLLFIWFAFTCVVDAKLLCYLYAKARHAVKTRTSVLQRVFADHIAIAAMTLVFFVYFVCKLTSVENGIITVPYGTAFTLFFTACLMLALSIVSIRQAVSNAVDLISAVSSVVVSSVFIVFWTVIWLRQYTQSVYRLTIATILVLLFLLIIVLVMQTFCIIRLRGRHKRIRFFGGSIACTAAVFFLLFSVTASSAMTIIRECKSSYQVYTASESELAEQIQKNTEPDAVVLANSYHWNLVTPLTGRSIVTGTGTFLFYHGIDTTERQEDVKRMFEEPADCADLFSRYHVQYVLISNAERMNYNIDYSYFDEHGSVLYKNDAGVLYQLSL